MGLTNEQLAMRKQGVSGSDLAAVCGLNPWRAPVNVWEEKLGLQKEDVSLNSAIIRGTLFEAPILQWYAHLSGRTVQQQTTIRHPEYPLIMATPDGIGRKADADDVCVEVKCASPQSAAFWGQAGTDEIAEYYLPQVQAQMAVTGLKVCDVVLFAGIEPAVYHVSYDDEFFQALREIAEKFWRDYVLTKKPPPPDSTAMYGEFLARYTPQKEERHVLDLEQHPVAAHWVGKLRAAKDLVKSALELEETAKNNLKALMAGYAHARLPGATASWKNQKPRKMTDWAALCRSASVPSELVERHTSIGKVVRPFKITFEKEFA